MKRHAFYILMIPACAAAGYGAAECLDRQRLWQAAVSGKPYAVSDIAASPSTSVGPTSEINACGRIIASE